MFCSNCGNKLADGSNFCPGCGNKVGEAVKVQTQTEKSIPVAAQTYFEQGKKYQENNDHNNAIASYNEAIKICPDFPEAQKRLVEVAFFNIEANAGPIENILNSVISKNPEDYEAFYLQGKLYAKVGNAEKALMAYNIALKLKPDFLETYKDMIRIYKSMKNWDSIVDISSNAINIAPNDYFLLNSRGLAFFNKKSYDNALTDYNTALALDKNNTDCLYNRGMLFYKTKKYDDALADIRKLLEKQSENFDILLLYGKISILKEDYEKAILNLAKCIAIMNKTEKYHTLEPFEYHAEACLKAGKYKEVREDYIQILEINPEYNFKNPSCFIDGLVGYFQDALKKYISEKKTYVLLHYKASRTRKKHGIIKIGLEYGEKSLCTLIDYAPVVFYNEEHADEYRDTLSNYWLRKNGYPLRKSDYYFKQQRERDRYSLPEMPSDYYSTINEFNEEPSTWFILYKPRGRLYHIDDNGELICGWLNEGCISKNSNSRFSKIEDAISTYKKIVERIIGNIEDFDLSSDGKFVSRCTDFVIAGTYDKESLSAFRNAFDENKDLTKQKEKLKNEHIDTSTPVNSEVVKDVKKELADTPVSVISEPDKNIKNEKIPKPISRYQQFVNVLTGLKNNMKNDSFGDNVYFLNIPEKKVLNARKALKIPDNEKVILLIDDTAFGSAKDATIFTDKGIYFKLFFDYWTVSWKELFSKHFFIETAEKTVVINIYKEKKTAIIKKYTLDYAIKTLEKEIISDIIKAGVYIFGNTSETNINDLNELNEYIKNR